jgi:hypothetical protein
MYYSFSTVLSYVLILTKNGRATFWDIFFLKLIWSHCSGTASSECPKTLGGSHIEILVIEQVHWSANIFGERTPCKKSADLHARLERNFRGEFFLNFRRRQLRA